MKQFQLRSFSEWMQVFDKEVSDGNDFDVGRNPNLNQKSNFNDLSHFFLFLTLKYIAKLISELKVAIECLCCI